MKQVPVVYSPTQIQQWDCQTETTDGKWIPARPSNYYGLRLLHRIHVAWQVFLGNYDALDWNIDSPVSEMLKPNVKDEPEAIIETQVPALYIVDHIASKYHDRVGQKISSDGHHTQLRFIGGETAWFRFDVIKPRVKDC
jgi:hypothetical protein